MTLPARTLSVAVSDCAASKFTNASDDHCRLPVTWLGLTVVFSGTVKVVATTCGSVGDDVFQGSSVYVTWIVVKPGTSPANSEGTCAWLPRSVWLTWPGFSSWEKP